mgnify:CR=1 FL=1
MFKDLTINIWTIVYDNDPARMYCFHDFDKAVKSIEGSLRCYVDDDEDYEQVVEFVLEFVEAHSSESCIPIKFGNLNIIIFKWTMDYSTALHQILSDCYEKIDDDVLKSRIKWLFNGVTN